MTQWDREVEKDVFSRASAEAPVIFTDHIPHFGSVGDVIAVTLSAGKPLPPGIVPLPAAHLRMPRSVALLLIESLQKAVAMVDRGNNSVN